MDRHTKFDIAVSFAGEDREYVDKVATLLRQKGISVFYDSFEDANLWGKNLYDYLSDIYQNQAKYTIVFISEFYDKKLWTNLERKAMQSRAFQESEEYILPVKFDDTKIPGILPTIGYLDLREKTPEQLVEIIERKLIYSGRTIPSENLRKALSTITPIPKKEPLQITIRIVDNDEKVISQAQVLLSADNGTYLSSETDENGVASFSISTRRLYKVLIAHPKFQSFIYENYDPNYDINIKLNNIENIGSILINSTGRIPGLEGRLNPILDNYDRMYLYANNISINDGKNQPVFFKTDEPILLEDRHGVIMNIIIRFIDNETTVIDYIKPVYNE